MKNLRFAFTQNFHENSLRKFWKRKFLTLFAFAAWELKICKDFCCFEMLSFYVGIIIIIFLTFTVYIGTVPEVLTYLSLKNVAKISQKRTFLQKFSRKLKNFGKNFLDDKNFLEREI